VTSDPREASHYVAHKTPVVLVGGDAEEIGQLVAGSPDERERERFLGVMVGDPSSAEVLAAADEMAGELWQWARGTASPPGL